MGFEFKPKNEKTFVAGEVSEVDTRLANTKVSKIGFDEDTKTFWTTIDRVSLKSLHEIITQVLLAHNYVDNFENILACLDQSGIGLRAQVDANDEKQIKQFNYVFYFKMPQKGKRGNLLHKFYEEIAIYERAILEGKKIKNQEVTQIPTSEELKKAKQEIMLLKQRIAELAQKNHNPQSQWLLQNANTDNNLYKVGKVTSVRLAERMLTLKVDNKSLNHPIQDLKQLPEEGQVCIMFYGTQNSHQAWFPEAKSKIDFIPAIILFKQDQMIKMRDSNRRTHSMHAISQEEIATFQSLERGSLVLLGLTQNKITSIQSMRTYNQKIFTDIIQEAVATNQINMSIDEEVQGEIAELRKAS